MTKVNASQFRTSLNRVFKKSTRWDEVSDTKAVKDEEQRDVIKATLSTRYNLTGNNTTPVVQKELPPEAASTIKVSNEPAAKKESCDSEEYFFKESRGSEAYYEYSRV